VLPTSRMFWAHRSSGMPSRLAAAAVPLHRVPEHFSAPHLEIARPLPRLPRFHGDQVAVLAIAARRDPADRARFGRGSAPQAVASTRA